MEDKINEQELFDNGPLLKDEDIKELNFFESCLYLEKLNLLDELTGKEGEDDE